MEEGSEENHSARTDDQHDLTEERQSCTGNIFTKFQCIRAQELDSPNDASVVSGDSPGVVGSGLGGDGLQVQETKQEGISVNNDSGSVSGQTVDTLSAIQSDHNVQGCSGSLLTTFQCITMPFPDSEVSSISSLENHGRTQHNPEGQVSSVRESFRSGKHVEVGSAITDLESVEVHVKDSPNNANDSRESSDNSFMDVPSTSSGATGTNEESSDATRTSLTVPNDEGGRSRSSSAVESADGDRDFTYTYMRSVLQQDTGISRDRLNAILLTLQRDIDELDFDDDFEFGTADQHRHIQQLYPMGPLRYVECDVCFELKDLNLRACCDKPVCDDCILGFITVQVEQAIVRIHCPITDCEKYIHRDEIMTRLTGELKDKFYKFLIDANKDPHVKTCPRCSTAMVIEPSLLKDRKVKKNGLWYAPHPFLCYLCTVY